eukprot:6253471-Ditylum_brightwellii.AAC.1
MDECNRIGTPHGVKIVLVSGYSGVGKSALVQHIRGKLNDKKCHFISGKFDWLQAAKLLYAIDSALNEYANSVIQEDAQYILDTKKAIIDTIQEDLG